MVKKVSVVMGLCIVGLIGLWFFSDIDFNVRYEVGQPIDSLNGVAVYYNGRVNNVTFLPVTLDGYNLGLEYQCVEFVKRYYFEHFNHEMPNSYGHARDFFEMGLPDGQLNLSRNLIQFVSPSTSKPKENDILVFKETFFNRFGHVAIISDVTENSIEIVQQNPGTFGPTRENLNLELMEGKWRIDNDRILGWLRKD